MLSMAKDTLSFSLCPRDQLAGEARGSLIFEPTEGTDPDNPLLTLGGDRKFHIFS